jgi:hypothetical protein
MDTIFCREAKHDVMIAATVVLFMILLLIVPPVHGDEPLPAPAKHEVLSPNKKLRAELDPREGTKIINVESGRVFWQLPDWYRWAFLADDGEHFVTGYDGLNLIPLDYTKKLVLITFWEKGNKIMEITVGDLFPDTRVLQRTASHYQWGYIYGIDRDGFLHVKKCDGLEILLDVRTGAKREKGGP